MGIQWKATFDALNQASNMYAWAFVIYIFFMLFGLSNTVVAMFVDSCLQAAGQVKIRSLHDARRHLSLGFNSANLAKDGEVTLTDFVGFLDNIHMREHLMAMELTLSEAKGIFHLLDADGKGRCDVHEVLYACEKFSRPVRSVDFVSVLVAIQRLHHEFKAFRSVTQDRFMLLGGMVTACNE